MYFLLGNKAFYSVCELANADIVKQSIYHVLGQQLDVRELKKLLEDVLIKKKDVADFEMTLHFPQKGEND